MEKAQKILVVNADDFGLSEGINCGIQSAYNNGILRSTSLMPNGSAFDHALTIASETPDLGVGIHISLVGEKCVAPVDSIPSLVSPNGDLPASYASFGKLYITGRIKKDDLRIEIQSQIDRVLSSGIKPTHIDSHQHLHILPGVFDIVLNAAIYAGIPVIRIPLEQNGIQTRGIQQKVLKFLCNKAKSKLKGTSIRIVDHFWGFGNSGNMDETNLLQTINLLQQGINEIMCHPGISDPATEAKYPWDYHWDAECSALQSKAVLELIESQRIKVANFRDAWKQS